MRLSKNAINFLSSSISMTFWSPVVGLAMLIFIDTNQPDACPKYYDNQTYLEPKWLQEVD